jgi:hypothetical protein
LATDIFEPFKLDNYTFGDCSVRAYDRRDTATYPDDFLLQLYRAMKASGTLSVTFCGMTDLSAPAICAYLSTRSPLLLMFADDTVIGFSFPAFWVGSKSAEQSMCIGYTAFKQAWGMPELAVCMMLTAIYYFSEFNLRSICGQRYAFNHLTAKFLQQFGVRETGYLPDFLLYDGKLVECRLSNLSRSDFEQYVSRTLLECANP